MPTITHLVAHFPPDSYGGMETHVRGLASELSSYDDIDITVVTTADDAPTHDHDFTVRWASRVCTVGKAVLAPTLPLHVYRSDPDLIHVHVPFHGGLEVAYLCGRLLDVPVVATVHMYGWDPTLLHTVYTRFLFDPLLRRCDALVGSTDDYLLQFPLFDELSERVDVIPHGVDTDRFAPVDDGRCREFREKHDIPVESPIVLFVGSFDRGHYYKRVDWLLEAMTSVVERLPNARLVVVGTGDRRDAAEAYSRELGLDDSVHLVGFLPDDEIPTAYSVADVFVLPSEPDLSESFGIVQLEAMACGTPVIATDTPGPRDVARSSGGRVFSAGDTDALSRHIRDLLKKESDPREHASHTYDWTVVADQWHDLYGGIV